MLDSSSTIAASSKSYALTRGEAEHPNTKRRKDDFSFIFLTASREENRMRGKSHSVVKKQLNGAVKVSGSRPAATKRGL